MPNNRRRNAPRKQRTNNRRRRNNGPRRNSSHVLPPARTLMGHILRTIVQTAWDITQGALSIPHDHFAPDRGHIMVSTGNPSNFSATIDNGWLLAQGWLDRFKGLFTEIKVHSIVCHFLPYESITAPGEYAFAVCDYEQDAAPNSFSEMVGMPASVIRKNGTPSKLTWYPTEPDDRNWILLSSTHKWCSTYLWQAEGMYNIEVPVPTRQAPVVYQESSGVQGKIVVEVNASFRGKPKKPSVGYHSPANSDAYREYLKDNPCVCNKCMKLLMKGLLSRRSLRDSGGFEMVQ